MRRKLAHKRRIDKLEEERDHLQQIVEALRDSSDDKALQLLNLIRSQVPLAEVQLYIQHRMTEQDCRQSPIWSEVSDRSDSHGPSLRHALSIQRLVDTPLFRIPAKPWTSVTESDDFVSHLVSIWLTWSQPLYNWVDRDLFLRDAQAGKMDSPFCSPFLMNCILTEACFYSDYPEAYADPTDRNSKGLHFYEEAQRWYTKVEGQLDLPTLQGCGLLVTCKAVFGKDRAAWWHLNLLRSLAADYTETYPLPATETLESRADNYAIWGIYNLTATASICLMKHLALAPPDRPRPPCNHNPDDTWVPYPHRASPVQSHISCVFNGFCELSTIAIHATSLVFGSEPKPSPEDLTHILKEVRTRLDQWRDNLPECLIVENITVPHALTLHMFYNTTIMTLWGLLQETDSTTAHAAREIRLEAAESFVQLLRIHRAKWGIDYISIPTITCLITTLFTLLDDLDNPNYKSAFTELCVIARAIYRKWAPMKGLMRMLQTSTQKNAVSLPPEIHTLFVDFEVTI
ncbi:C6 transcription factor [Aspergillus sclerotiicarbonarius CBS 121057]|uniref:C6 transcription factor n=1 Tax=Aspergillus sclerotiicarbonarius (strain CBS 121057 / IBT 28362) TaxID=1448318 RepID=A0A319E1T0_ASPSB|nr:C6 transcription factor [Aspergillus sclerotiicarbonarius CBS 121057]